MYDLNLSVPNISTSKYTDDEKFSLIKNYLYELNETLSYALGNLDFSNFSPTIKASIETKEATEEARKEINEDSLKKFNKLKNEIIITADEIFKNCQTSIEESEAEILLKAEKEFVTQSKLGEYKNDVEALISETAEEVKLNTKEIESVNSNLENYKNENNAELNVRATAIISQVENIFAEKSQVEDLSQKVSTQITQTAQNIVENYKTEITSLENDISTLGGEVTELVYSLDAYIRRGELESGVYGIEIGRNDSIIKARFTNDKLSFIHGNTEVAYISENNLYILRAEITDYLKLGDSQNGFFIFDVTDNGLEVRWSYGS